MPREFSSDSVRVNLVDWRNQITDPVGTLASGPTGSWWLRNGSYPTRPTEIFLKTAGPNGSWTKQNAVNINVFNVKRFGAVGDGVTDDRLAIQAAINAAVAIGGGFIYFPATNASYRITKSGLQSFLLSNVHDLTFFGDGFASTLAMIDNAALGEWHAFTLRNGTTRIKFINLGFLGSGITNPDPANQAHFIQISGVAGDPFAGATDVDVVGCWFGQIKGAAVRNLAESGKEVSNIRILYNAFDMVAARSNVEAQRYSRRLRIAYNWCSGTASGNVIDFEPTGGSGLGTAGPEEWDISCNVMDNGNQDSAAMTVAGAGTLDPTQRNIVAYNILLGSHLSSASITNCLFKGNVITVASSVSEQVLRMFSLATQNVIFGNVLVSLNANGTGRSAIGFINDVGLPTRIMVTDNICKMQSTNATGGQIIDCESNTDTECSGNILVADTTVASKVYGVLIRSTGAPEADHVIANGNLAIPTNQQLLSLVAFAASPNNVRNSAASFNYSNTSFSCIRWERAAAQTFLDWRMCNDNNGANVSNATVELPATNVGVSIEGAAGPGAQWIELGTTPGGNATAPVGSALVNRSGAAATILWIKETGTGTAGWVQDGDMEFIFAVGDVGVATAARFLAPGMGLAAVSTVEIKFPIPRPGTVRNFRLTCVAGIGGGTNTYVVRKNGVNQSMAVAILNTATTGADVSHPFAVAAGDLVSVQITKSAAPATGQTNVAIMMALTS